MKKRDIIILSAVAFGTLFTGCKSSYEKYSNDEFTIDYPRKWEKEINMFPVMPFVAFSEYQTAMVSTKDTSGITLEDFAKARIKAFEEEQIGFKLISLDVDDKYALIRYSNDDEDDPNYHLETLMKIGRRGEKLYGVTCAYENNAQKDTVEHIINSFQLK
ncbi:MAG: hypothetical protein J6T67_04950 [Paludibacteraceae bacterium]|nr:hypothetical protein [Paludibacteraceae bacterium]